MSKITFQKRQKEMKRQEKARMKADRRAQKKIASQTEGGAQPEVEEIQLMTGPAQFEPEA